jgi:CBS domain-containing protein
VKVQDVYRPHISTCPPSTIVHDVAQRMVRFDAGLVAIVHDGRLVGVITERDLVRALAWDSHPLAAPVMAYATTPVVTARPDEDASVVACRMVEAGVRRLPVVDPAGELLGLVSMRDLFAVEVLMDTVGQGAA